jgi:hypothetical protein
MEFQLNQKGIRLLEAARWEVKSRSGCLVNRKKNFCNRLQAMKKLLLLCD